MARRWPIPDRSWETVKFGAIDVRFRRRIAIGSNGDFLRTRRLCAMTPLGSFMSTAAYEIKLTDLLFERSAPESIGAMIERTEAVKKALRKGVPLHQIESYLDWADTVRDGCHKT
jgi:hypothetical protein